MGKEPDVIAQYICNLQGQDLVTLQGSYCEGCVVNKYSNIVGKCAYLLYVIMSDNNLKEPKRNSRKNFSERFICSFDSGRGEHLLWLQLWGTAAPGLWVLWDGEGATAAHWEE